MTDSLKNKLSQLFQKGLELWLDDGKLGFKAPPNLLVGENLEFIKSEKPNIITLLQSEPDLMKGFVLSQGQQSMYIGEQIEHNFNLAALLRLKTQTDISEQLQNAIDQTLAQHPILTARFGLSGLTQEDGPPIIKQQYLEQRRALLETIDSQDNGTDTDIEQLARQLARQTFNLENDTLIRFTLIDQSHLLVSCHHIVCDFMGLQNVLLDLQTHFSASNSTDNTDKLNGRLRQTGDKEGNKEDYKTHIINEANLGKTPEFLAEQYSQEHRNFDFTGFSQSNNALPNNTTQSSGEYTLTLKDETTRAILSKSKQQQSTPYHWALCALSIFLQRLSLASSENFFITTPLANRYASFVQQAGHFTNPMVFSSQGFDQEASFSGLLKQTQEQCNHLLKVQQFPSEPLLKQYDCQSNIAFSFNKLNHTAFEGELYQALLFAEQFGSTHDLIITGIQSDSKDHTTIQFNFRYNSTRLSFESIKHLASSFERCLIASCELESDAATWPSSFSLLSEEQAQQLHQINQTQVEYDSRNLATQFFEVAQQYPHHEALRIPASVLNQLGRSEATDSLDNSQDISVSYQELANQATVIAKALKEQINTSSDQVVKVGLFVERDQYYLSSLLAVLAIGAVAVPLDTQFPAERIQHMLSSSGVNTVLSLTANQTPLIEEKPELAHQLNWIVLDGFELNGLQNKEADSNFVHDIKDTPADSLNFIFFTSGSTGLPKAVPVSQQAVCRLTHHNRFFEVNQGESCLFSSNISFDATNIEIWQTLLHGGRLVAVDKDTFISPSPLRDVFEKHQVKHAFFTTALFNSLIYFDAKIFSSFITVMFGGEACDNRTIEQCIKQGKPQRLQHLYGPTENGSITTYHTLDRDSFDIQQHTSIGLPTGNSSVWILDRFNQLQVPGAPGELVVGGDAVSTGYLAPVLESDQDKSSTDAIIKLRENIETLNREKFIADHLSSPASQTQRLYRSGDTVYQDVQGRIYFLGRTDDQVKVRGFRIQLSEIEQQLLQLENIQKAVVLAKAVSADEQIEKQLVAYVVLNKSQDSSKEDKTQTPKAIKQALAQALPAHMVPPFIIILEALPLNANGKIDKRQLPEPAALSEEQTSTIDESTLTETQTKLLTIWRTQCHLSVNSLDDNFFEIGGSSLLAVRMAASLEAEHHSLNIRYLFEHPSIRLLAEFLDGSENSNVGSNAYSNAEVISSAISLDQTTQYPASLNQQRLWFVQQLQPESTTYNMPLAIKLSSQLKLNREQNQAKLTQAFNQLRQKHPILNARFIDQDGQAACILDHNPTDIEIQELADQQALEQALTQDAHFVFNLGKDNLLQAKAYQIAQGSSSSPNIYLSLNLHHIIADGWSVQLLLADLYAFLNSDQALSLLNQQEHQQQYHQPSYIDYAHFQNDDSQAIQEQDIRYWQSYLEGASSSLNLPIDKARPAIFAGLGDSVTSSFTDTQSQRLREAAQKHQVSLFSFLMLSYQLLLSRITNSKDICVGFPVHGRNDAIWHNTVGLFTNNLVSRRQFQTTVLSVHQAIQDSHNDILAALDHQSTPFDLWLDHLDIEKSLSFVPLLQASFSLEEHSLASLIETNLHGQAELIDNHWQVAKYDLHLSCFDESAISLLFEFNQEIFIPSSIQRFLGYFKQLSLALAEAALDNADSAVHSLQLLTEDEQLTLTQGSYNDTDYAFEALEKQLSIHDLFEAQVDATPESVAVRDEQYSLSYAQLNTKANQLAHHLQNIGVQAHDVVAVQLDRSVSMSVALLGILKAGAAYTPLLSDTPLERLQFIVEETQAKVLITDTVSGSKPTALLNLADSDTQASLQALPETNLNTDLSKHYYHTGPQLNLIYTSGSTGKPKGVMVPHQGIVNRLLWMQRAYPLNANDIVLQKTPYNFDVSVWELFWPLIVGASIYYAKPEGHKDPSYLSEVIQAQNISCIHFVPSMLNAFNQGTDVSQCTSLRQVFTSGEALQIPQANALLEALPNTGLYNLYGPTEASIDVSYYDCIPNEPRASIPIGRPIDNIKLYVLDEDLQLLPQGAIGDLYISGIGLAEGYLNRDELNQQTFLTNPYSSSKKDNIYSRLYKTGDVARLLEDGNIEYLGRSDNQVKLRGLRIELGEIEQQLLNQKAIKQSVVITQNVRSEEQLVAYIVYEDDQSALDDQQLRLALSRHLPEYMLPFCFIPLKEMPLSANGKLDRKQLPKAEDLIQQHTYVAPENDTEVAIAKMFEDILQVEQVGSQDNFFHLGGHSLLATKLASRIRLEFDCPFELKQVFDHPTVYELSLAVIEQTMGQLGLDDIDDDDLLALLDDL